jgi:hypothetical protein
VQILLASGLLFLVGPPAWADSQLNNTPPPEQRHRPVDGIMDNSFLIEEAYNQEAGIVQHIFNAIYSINRIAEPGEKRVDLLFTQEWPVYGQTHQFSYTIPYSLVRESGLWSEGLGDVLLNYRYQLFFEEETLRACAPRFSLILPTGDRPKGFGNGTTGYQWNVPVSTAIGDNWFAHLNSGLTYVPNAGTGHRRDLLSFNLGASAIYCINDRLNLMLEWIANWTAASSALGGVRHEFASVISPGVRRAFNFNSETQFVIGLAAPIGLTRDAPDIGAFLYLSFEHRLFGKAEKP